MSQSATDLDARAALRLRQGVGARYDAASAPAEDLLLARRGTAYFARRLAALDDGALDGSAARGGVSRRWVIAQLGYHARDMAQRVASGRGATRYDPPPERARQAEVARGATLPARALRSLIQHAAIHLDVEWRDLSDAGWDRLVLMPDGRLAALRETPRLQAAAIWQAALDLANGGRLVDVPGLLRSEMEQGTPGLNLWTTAHRHATDR